jgi:hypothetical protein
MNPFKITDYEISDYSARVYFGNDWISFDVHGNRLACGFTSTCCNMDREAEIARKFLEKVAF